MINRKHTYFALNQNRILDTSDLQQTLGLISDNVVKIGDGQQHVFKRKTV